MAHERSRVEHSEIPSGGTASAEELQRLLRAKRESITQTIEEIKMNMQTGYHDTKDKVTETLDWRLQMQKYPMAAIAGALAVGFLAGQVLGRSVSGPSTSSRRHLSSGSSFGAGTSLAPGSNATVTPKEPRHLISPTVKSKVVGRIEDVITDMAENLLTEVSRVGRDVIVPTIVSNLTSAFTQPSSHDSTTKTYSPKSATESTVGSTAFASGTTAAGGPIAGEPSHGGRFQGRGI